MSQDEESKHSAIQVRTADAMMLENLGKQLSSVNKQLLEDRKRSDEAMRNILSRLSTIQLDIAGVMRDVQSRIPPEEKND